MICSLEVKNTATVLELTGAGASGRSLVGFLICLVDSRRAGIFAGFGVE